MAKKGNCGCGCMGDPNGTPKKPKPPKGKTK
jgi:hypothetical protein